MSDAPPPPLAEQRTGRHEPPLPRQQPAMANAIAKLAMATQVFLMVCGVLSAATIGIEAFGISAVTSFLERPVATTEMLDVYDQSTSVVAILSSLCLIATGVLWATWQYRVAKQVVGRTRRSPGWHAGSWFVPVVSFWFPYQNLSDLWRAVGRRRPSWQIAWWLLFLISNFIIQQSARIATAAVDLEQFRVAMWVSLAGEMLLLAATPLAWLIVRGITEGILQPAPAPGRSPAA
jgi:hypothetical protein